MENEEVKCICPYWMKHSRNIPCITKRELEENAEEVLSKFNEVLEDNIN